MMTDLLLKMLCVDVSCGEVVELLDEVLDVVVVGIVVVVELLAVVLVASVEVLVATVVDIQSGDW